MSPKKATTHTRSRRDFHIMPDLIARFASLFTLTFICDFPLTAWVYADIRCYAPSTV